MRISTLIGHLANIMADNGDLRVVTCTNNEEHDIHLLCVEFELDGGEHLKLITKKIEE